MEELELGPNGGLVYCMEYLLDNMDWLKDELDKFDEDEYIIFDCPGQARFVPLDRPESSSSGTLVALRWWMAGGVARSPLRREEAPGKETIVGFIVLVDDMR